MSKFLNLNYSEITFLLARSFFIDLCMAVFSLLARVRVLIQQVSVIIYISMANVVSRKFSNKLLTCTLLTS
jgi:hypothetical protein